MKTVTELLADLAGVIRTSAQDLLLNHSRLERDGPDGVLVVMGGDFNWQPLSQEASRIQAKLKDDYSRFRSLLECLLRNQPPGVLQGLRRADSTVTKLLDQQGYTSASSPADAWSRFDAAIDEQLRFLPALYDRAEGEHVYVPDTNALLYNTMLEGWRFDDSPRFVLLLLPTVLTELDQLKVNHRVETVRDKAEKLVRQFFEYRRRGNLNDGVVLRKDSHRLRTLAVEPDFPQTLPWLDRENNDDRILAGFIEVMRQHPRCQVALVTRDINLANKADYARVPCVFPPEPPKGGTV
jgi:hypothetical protein